MAQGFITNSEEAVSLKDRLNQIIPACNELKFLVGFFYFSGIAALYEPIRNNPQLTIKILVGMQVDKAVYGLYEHADRQGLSERERVNGYYDSIKKSLNSDEFDNQTFYEQVSYFLDLIKQNKLMIRKTLEPSHSKLYLFQLKDAQVGKPMFITGSSNLTDPGLSEQDEFNVEISDYGYDQALERFEEKWDSAIRITEDDEYRQRLINVLENDTHTKRITPFEAYALTLKTYIESFPKTEISDSLKELMQSKGYTPYMYQFDAAKQALSIIAEHNGVIIADVVGLGKSVIAGIVANQMGSRGIVICPPGLIGKKYPKSGWHQYLIDFELDQRGWEIFSRGDLENVEGYISEHPEIEVIVIDEAHNFRNQDTDDYERLTNICRGRNVILLTATPFNNSPNDLLSLVSLFVTPKKSHITLDDNLRDRFRSYNSQFNKLATIKKHYKSSDSEKQLEAKKAYKSLFGTEEISINEVEKKVRFLASEIRSTIEPITVRRNRLDLINHPIYSKEVQELSVVDKPIEWFYYLNDEQSKFYDKIITSYFAEPDDGGVFTGAIYRPYAYAKDVTETKATTEESAFAIQSQTNLFDFMRRLVVKRFESSSKSFADTLNRFISINYKVLQFIEASGGQYVLERKIIDKFFDCVDSEEIEQALILYENDLTSRAQSKSNKGVYNVNKFVRKEEFFDDIKSDIELFKSILEELQRLNFIGEDPKLRGLINEIRKKRTEEINRKIIIFSEYGDTVDHVGQKLNEVFRDRVLIVHGSLSDSVITRLAENFDAKFPLQSQKNDYDIIVTTDKLAEGFNLNRAGMIVNYDIPWNPVRVIQRLGRINRMSKKVFKSLQIANFFPSEKGASIVKSREIAQHKMFLIHHTLGEDSQIFGLDEEPTESKLFERLNDVKEDVEGESFYTRAYKDYVKIKEKHPELINQLQSFPRRIKVAKHYEEPGLMVFIKKGALFVGEHTITNRRNVSLEQVYPKVKCDYETKSLPLSDDFWVRYKSIQELKLSAASPRAENNLEVRAKETLKKLYARSDMQSESAFISDLIEDIEEYGTLPPPTLRRISEIQDDGEALEIAEKLNELEKTLGGEGYLQRLKDKFPDQTKELIIAVENQ